MSSLEETGFAKPRTTPGGALVWALGKRAAERKEIVLNPRTDHIWSKRDNGKISISIHKGKNSWPVSHDAWMELGGILGIPQSLMDRLATLPKDEDCRLVNTLLWDRGSDDDWKLRFVIGANTIVAATLGEYRSLSAERLARTLERLESAGEIHVAKWELTDFGWWIVVGFSRKSSLDLSQGSGGERDLWEKGALLFNHEDGKTAAAVVPGIIRSWGKYWLPIAPGTVRRHDGSGDALVDVVKALQIAESAPFETAAGRLRAIQGARTMDAEHWVGKLSSPWNEAQKQAVRAAVGAGRTNGYQVLTAAMRVGYLFKDPVKRLAALRHLGAILMEGRAGK